MKDAIERKQRWARWGGWYSLVGNPKRRAQVNGLSTRREQQMGAGDPKGLPQDFGDWWSRMVKADPLRAEAILAGMLDEVVRAEASHTDEEWEAAWVDACRYESASDERVDYCQREARTNPTPEILEAVRVHAPREAVGAIRLSVLAEARLRAEAGR